MEIDVLITILIGCLCIFFPRSKAISFIAFTFMWTLWGLNLWNGDYIAYLSQYYGEDAGSTEFGFELLCNLFSKFIPFQVFMVLLSSIILYSLYHFIVKYTTYPALFTLFYFPMFILEYVFTRNYICLLLILWAIFIALERKSVKLPIFIIILSSTIHIFSICYIPLLLCINKNIKLKSVLFLVMVIYVVVLVFGTEIFGFSQYLSSKAEFYQREGENTISLTTPFHLFIVLLMHYLYKKTSKYAVNNKEKLEKMAKINYYSLIFIPVYFIIPYSASRSLRFLIVYSLFFVFIMISSNDLKCSKTVNMTLFILLLCIGVLFSMQKFDFVLYPLYHCNLLWGFDPNYQLIY